VQNVTLWRSLLGIERSVVEEIDFDEVEEVVVAHVRPKKGVSRRCGRCQKRSPWYDQGEGR
jgi:transposase